MSPGIPTMKHSSRNPWSPDSWRGLPAAQQPVYADPAAVEAVLAELLPQGRAVDA